MSKENRSSESVTDLLVAWRGGQAGAAERLMDRVYSELSRIAGRYLRRENRDDSLEPAALVHEAYLRLVDQEVDWENRGHFYAVASTLIRRLLIDRARARQRDKRKGFQVSLHEDVAVTGGLQVEMLALDRALNKLKDEGYEIESEVVLLRFFGGLTIDEVAEHLGSSTATVGRAWAFARTWLRRELERDC